jgi:hypothetical protein
MEHAQTIAFQQLCQATQTAAETFNKAYKFANPSDFDRQRERDWPKEKRFQLERLEEEQVNLKDQTERLARAWALYTEGKYSEAVTTLMGTEA